MKCPLSCVFILCMVLGIISKSNGQKPHFNEDAIRLNKQATILLGKYPYVKDSIEKAILIYDKAILIDPTYFLAYFNKANAQCSLNLYQQVINTMNELLLIEPKTMAAYMFQAEVLEKLGRYTEAKEKYQTAMTIYHELMAKNSYSSKLASSYLYDVFLKDGQEEAVKEYKKIKTSLKNPDPNLDLTIEEIKKENRDECIDGFCGSKTE